MRSSSLLTIIKIRGVDGRHLRPNTLCHVARDEVIIRSYFALGAVRTLPRMPFSDIRYYTQNGETYSDIPMCMKYVSDNKQRNNINEVRTDNAIGYAIISVTCVTNLSGCKLSVSRSLTALLVHPALGGFLWMLTGEVGQARNICAINVVYYEHTEPLGSLSRIPFLHSLQICRLFPL
jgi:hypothetical protein